MAKSKDLIEFKSGRNSQHLYIKSAWLERYFKELCRNHFGDTNIGEFRLKGKEDPLFSYYKCASLPSTPYSLQCKDDLFNNYGFMRAVGLRKGIRIPIDMPISKDMAVDLVNRISENVRHLYSLYCDQFEVRREFVVEDGNGEDDQSSS